jgi:hypothetical protein
VVVCGSPIALGERSYMLWQNLDDNTLTMPPAGAAAGRDRAVMVCGPCIALGERSCVPGSTPDNTIARDPPL